jgi:hypothetical protein
MRNGTSARRSAALAPRNVRPLRVARLKPGAQPDAEKLAAAPIVTRIELISRQRPEGKTDAGTSAGARPAGPVGFRRRVDDADKAA